MVTLNRIAKEVNGLVVGDSNYEIDSIRSLSSSTSRSISFFCDKKLKNRLSDCAAGALLISEQDADLFSGNKIVVADPYLSYAKISKLFKPEPLSAAAAIDSGASICASATLGKNVRVGKFSIIADNVDVENDVVIGNTVNIGCDVEIGEGTVIEDQVVIYSGTKIGRRCHLSSGVVLGANGFGYASSAKGWEKIEQLGNVTIGDDVDIGVNTTVDRGALESTVIENNVKLDNQIQIAHNVVIGENTIMAGCSAVAGSTTIGRRCKIGGRASILGHLSIADDVTIMSNSLVSKDIKSAGEYASMIPVQPVKLWRKNLAIVRQLDKLSKKMSRLQRQESGSRSKDSKKIR